VELIIHLLFDPVFPSAPPFRTFVEIPSSPVRMGMNGDDSDPVASHYEHAEAKVRVPGGSKLSNATGPWLLVVPGLPHPLIADEVWDFAESGKHGFAILEGAEAK
jgi:hypothetical protein